MLCPGTWSEQEREKTKTAPAMQDEAKSPGEGAGLNWKGGMDREQEYGNKMGKHCLGWEAGGVSLDDLIST